ncbi:hypothetical protein KX816_13635 [Sphingosinicellaceae bacterium]|nr:hypothetical protein KX816_13635 [Sphingosinicellaceae bacterium]
MQSIKTIEPGAGEVWIEPEAIGVNYLDVTQRNGAVPIPLPGGLGLAGAGRVAAIGSGVALPISRFGRPFRYQRSFSWPLNDRPLMGDER